MVVHLVDKEERRIDGRGKTGKAKAGKGAVRKGNSELWNGLSNEYVGSLRSRLNTFLHENLRSNGGVMQGEIVKVLGELRGELLERV